MLSTLDHPVSYRKLLAFEINLLEEHLLRLSPHDRRMRFCGTFKDHMIHEYCAGIDWTKTTKLGCFIDGVLRGVADLVFDNKTFQPHAEVALSVEKPFQNSGIGTVLFEKSMTLARNRFVNTAHILCLRDNSKMRHIASKFKATLEFQGPDIEGTLVQPWPSYMTVIEEATLDTRAMWAATMQSAG